jgi:hypothetical protein
VVVFLKREKRYTALSSIKPHYIKKKGSGRASLSEVTSKAKPFPSWTLPTLRLFELGKPVKSAFSFFGVPDLTFLGPVR